MLSVGTVDAAGASGEGVAVSKEGSGVGSVDD